MSSPDSPDWAANRRVLFCVGDHPDAACEAWSFVKTSFLEPDDDVTVLRVWDPKSSSSDENPEEIPHSDSDSEPNWLPPLIRDGLRRREAVLPGSHKTVLLPEADTPKLQPVGSPRSRRRASTPAEQILRYASRHRATVVILAARPRHGTLERAILGSTSDEVTTNAEVPCLVVMNRDSDDITSGVSSNHSTPTSESSSPFEVSEGTYTYARAARERSPSPSTDHGRRIMIAVDASAECARCVSWCAQNLVRPVDEVVLIHALSNRACDDETYRRTYVDERSPPLGASAKEMRADADRAWSELENLLTRAAPLFPNLGPGKTQNTGGTPEDGFKTSVAIPNPGVIFAGTRNEAFVHQTRDAARWDDLDARVAKVASAQRSFRCGYPPRGVVVSGPARLALCDAVVRFEVDLLVVGSKGTTGLRRAVFPSVSVSVLFSTRLPALTLFVFQTHCVENAACPVLVFREHVDPADVSPRSPTY